MSRQVIHTDRVMKPIAHFSHAVRIGNLVHVGATAGTDAQRRLAGDTPGLTDAPAQIRKMFDNLFTVMELLGAAPRDTVRVKTYVADLRDLAVYDAIRAEIFGGMPPAHVVVGSAGFPLPQAAIELDAIAVVDSPIERLSDKGDAVLVGDRFHCVAQPSGDGASSGDFRQQADAAFRQLARLLAEGSYDVGEVVSLHATLQDVRDFDPFSAALAALFPRRAPACTVVIAQLPDPGMMLQLEAVAARGGGEPVFPASVPGATTLGSPAILAGDDLYVGGQLGVTAGGNRTPGVEEQTRVAWDRINALLSAAGFGAQSLLRTNNVLTDWRHYAGFNAGYGANVVEPFLPRATVLGALALRNASVQVEALGHRQGENAVIVQTR